MARVRQRHFEPVAIIAPAANASLAMVIMAGSATTDQEADRSAIVRRSTPPGAETLSPVHREWRGVKAVFPLTNVEA
jgi:hypothetical protein